MFCLYFSLVHCTLFSNSDEIEDLHSYDFFLNKVTVQQAVSNFLCLFHHSLTVS